MNGYGKAAAAVLGLALVSCSGGGSGGIEPKAMADAIHAVLESDRTVYTKQVVNRLQNDEKVIKASEHWKDDKALPLPAQMFRMGAEMVQQKDAGFTYALLSLWPVNQQNAPKTDVEKTGLQHVVDHPAEKYYAAETLGGTRYFTAVYPDVAIAPACITCHNEHKDSPRRDFQMGSVMGGVVIRIPVGG
ncbi:MAG: Tll0287-like domain-containing protein [Candidatus Binatia bacterium]